MGKSYKRTLRCFPCKKCGEGVLGIRDYGNIKCWKCNLEEEKIMNHTDVLPLDRV